MSVNRELLGPQCNVRRFPSNFHGNQQFNEFSATVEALNPMQLLKLPNPMQMSFSKELRSLTLGSAHKKCSHAQIFFQPQMQVMGFSQCKNIEENLIMLNAHSYYLGEKYYNWP